MKENQSRVHGSQTAEMVALCRALHYKRSKRRLIIEDRFARYFLSGKWRNILRIPLLEWFFFQTFFNKVRGIITYILFRARFPEESLLNAVKKEVDQVVILGAGFDTFALRNPALKARIFEVDVKASQDLKKQRLKAAKISIPQNLHFVSVDFEKDNLIARLKENGFNTTRPAFFNWMGVTYYLQQKAIRETMAQLTDFAASGSELILDYLTVEECLRESELALFKQMTNVVRKYGEPMISFFHPSTVQEDMGLGGNWDLIKSYTPAKDFSYILTGHPELDPAPFCFRWLHVRKK